MERSHVLVLASLGAVSAILLGAAPALVWGLGALAVSTCVGVSHLFSFVERVAEARARALYAEIAIEHLALLEPTAAAK